MYKHFIINNFSNIDTLQLPLVTISKQVYSQIHYCKSWYCHTHLPNQHPKQTPTSTVVENVVRSLVNMNFIKTNNFLVYSTKCICDNLTFSQDAIRFAWFGWAQTRNFWVFVSIEWKQTFTGNATLLVEGLNSWRLDYRKSPFQGSS